MCGEVNQPRQERVNNIFSYIELDQQTTFEIDESELLLLEQRRCQHGETIEVEAGLLFGFKAWIYLRSHRGRAHDCK